MLISKGLARFFFWQEVFLLCCSVPRLHLSHGSRSDTYQGFVLDLLSDELVLAQGIASLSSDGVDGPLLHLLLDGAVQHEQRLPSTILSACTQTHTLMT